VYRPAVVTGRWLWPCLLAALAVGGTLAPVACGGGEFSVGPAADGGDDGNGPDSGGSGADHGVPPSDGPSGDGGPDATHPALVVYVSAVSGSDANDGLTQAKPKKTIVAGLAAAEALGAGAEVHVCKGVYVESGLNLSAPVSLRGAWGCSTWTRTATFGYPTFDGVNQTTVQNGNATAQPATLLVSGGVPSNSVVDGLVVDGAATSSFTTIGVEVVDQATPVLRDCVVTGGGGNAGTSSAGSNAISVSGAAGPEIAHCELAGGSGTGTYGSVGLALATTGPVWVHDDVITGGTGKGTSGLDSVGAILNASVAGARAFARNAVSGTDAKATVTGASEGILVAGTNGHVDIVGCDVAGGAGTGAQTSSVGIGVSAAGTQVRIDAGRIYGGSRSGASSTTFGIADSAAGSVTVTNSFVHGGDVTSGVGSSTVGASLSGTSPTLEFDTIYLGSGGGEAIALAASTTSAVLSDDLLLGADSGDYAIVTAACSGAIASLDHTAFANFASGLYTCTASAFPPITTVSGLVVPFPSATSDRVVESSAACPLVDATYCIADASCPAPASTCAPSLFGAAWTVADDGVSGMFAAGAADAGAPGGGWTLVSPSKCALARGGAPVAGVSADAYGHARSPTAPTIGAAEYTGPCTQ